jgi:hypothetical protein
MANSATFWGIIITGSLCLVIATVLWIVYLIRVVEERDRAAPRLTKRSLDIWISSGALFLVGLFIFSIYGFLKRRALDVCQIATTGKTSTSGALSMGLWITILVVVLIAIALYATSVYFMQVELESPTPFTPANMAIAISSGAFFVVASILLVVVYLSALQSNMSTCFKLIPAQCPGEGISANWIKAIESMY